MPKAYGLPGTGGMPSVGLLPVPTRSARPLASRQDKDASLVKRPIATLSCLTSRHLIASTGSRPLRVHSGFPSLPTFGVRLLLETSAECTHVTQSSEHQLHASRVHVSRSLLGWTSLLLILPFSWHPWFSDQSLTRAKIRLATTTLNPVV